MNFDDSQKIHKTVLLQETINGLNIKDGGIYVDATCGFGGHSYEIAKKNPNGTLVVIDRDIFALETTKRNLENLSTKIFSYNGGFEDLDNILETFGIKRIDGIVFDLGVSSYQLDSSGRGFSFRKDEPLLMTMKENPTKDDVTAYDVVNTWSPESLESILYGFGEEKFARKIVAGIVSARDNKPIQTTHELVKVIEDSVPIWYRKSRLHPATRTFQAIRIAVNTELQSVEKALQVSTNFLNNGGKIAVISFHSLEDRIVKRFFKKLEDENIGKKLTKKPNIPSTSEISENPRSRSAKLRIFQKND